MLRCHPYGEGDDDGAQDHEWGDGLHTAHQAHPDQGREVATPSAEEDLPHQQTELGKHKQHIYTSEYEYGRMTQFFFFFCKKKKKPLKLP